jgi:hypothetical protein
MARRIRRPAPASEPPPPPPSTPSPRRPPVGHLEEVLPGPRTGSRPAPEAEADVPRDPPLPVAWASSAPTDVVRLAGRFPTAAAALVFAGQVDGLVQTAQETLVFAGSASTHTWWGLADLPLDLGRELIAAAHGSPYVEVDRILLPDRGWGPLPSPTTTSRNGRGAQAAPRDLAPVSLLELVRVSGLQRTAGTTGIAGIAGSAPDELVVLAPGSRVASIIQRGLDFGLDVQYRSGRLSALFGTPEPLTTVYEIVLRAASGGPMPPAILTALDHDPSALACRRAGPALLIQHQMASALPDHQLARLAEQDSADGRWVLASAEFGCFRLSDVGGGELRDGAELVRLADTYELTGPVPGWADEGVSAADALDASDSSGAVADAGPDRPELRLVRAVTRGATIDAVLLDDADLACVPALLEGQPLADVALLAPGRDHHLLVAPGGLLESLPVGEALYRIGPGPLYLALGHRLQPSLPPTARQTLFGADGDTAIVIVRSDSALAFDLTACQPVWRLWAGPVPLIDQQIPRDAVDALLEVERLTTPPPEAPRPAEESRTTTSRFRELFGRHTEEHPRTWRDDAWDAERAGEFTRAAEIHETNDDYRRAAHLWEIAAREGGR